MGGEATAKRLAIAKDLATRVLQFSEGIMLGGAAALGTATDQSDLDVVIVPKKGATSSIARVLGFQRLQSSRAISLLEQYSMGCAWASDVIDGVTTKCFLYNREKLAEHVTLRGSAFSIWRPDKPNEEAHAYGFDGKDMRLSRDFLNIQGGFVYNIPPLLDNKFYSTPIRENFLGTGGIIAENNSFLSLLRNDVWQATIEQLIRERTIHVDLNRHNVLNTIYAHHQKTLPQGVIDDIKKRTVRELNNYCAEI